MMSAMRLCSRDQALSFEAVAVPHPQEYEVVLSVAACGVCRTDLHLLDGELPNIHYPITPRPSGRGTRARMQLHRVTDLKRGERVGVPWLGYACGTCDYCRRGAENLCENAKFTGYTVDGGYAPYIVADARFCLQDSRALLEQPRQPRCYAQASSATAHTGRRAMVPALACMALEQQRTCLRSSP